MAAVSGSCNSPGCAFLVFACQPRQWRKPLTRASEAYRQLLTLARQKETQELRLGPQDQLANNCPRCFGPRIKSTRPGEPDFIVCCDGNFQHRRHKAASTPILGHIPPKPELFMEPAAVKAMAAKVTPTGRARERAPEGPGGMMVCKSVSDAFVTELLKRLAESFVVLLQDPCTKQHTAADNVRNKTSWPSCDDSGLVGLACRHDHLLQFVNVEGTGERYMPNRRHHRTGLPTSLN